MSVFGGDSWAREAQYRKRRIDDLILEGVEASSYKRLSNGKFACLVCPNNPILDTLIMLSTHMNGSRHQASELKRKGRELSTQEELRKRSALSDDCVSSIAAANTSNKPVKKISKPLIERARKAASDVYGGEVIRREVKSHTANVVLRTDDDCHSCSSCTEIEGKHKGVVGDAQVLDYGERLERQLKFTAAGWKRDGHGRWFKDENVEFDSDEEDPNIVFKDTI